MFEVDVLLGSSMFGIALADESCTIRDEHAPEKGGKSDGEEKNECAENDLGMVSITSGTIRSTMNSPESMMVRVVNKAVSPQNPS